MWVACSSINETAHDFIKNGVLFHFDFLAGALSKYGAFTGEAFGGMLKDVGCEWALCGHSERRAYQHESSALVAEKAAAALASGLGAVVCIGESLAERKGGMAVLQKVLLDEQMSALLKAIGTDPAVWANVSRY
jgi:triosephosphate isomerase